MRCVPAILAILLIVALTPPAEAAGPLRRIFHGRAAQRFHAAHPPLDAREVYSKYQAGFHARNLQNIGIPSGDIGLRGNGIYANPW